MGAVDERAVDVRIGLAERSETTFERDLTAPGEIEAGVQAMADDVWAWCEKAQAFGSGGESVGGPRRLTVAASQRRLAFERRRPPDHRLRVGGEQRRDGA